MNKHTTNIKEYPTYVENPIEIKGIKKKIIPGKERTLTTDEETGERIIIEKAAPSKTFLVDESKRISIYDGPLLDLLPNISTSGLFVLSYIFKNLPKNKDVILLYPSAIMEYFNHKTSTVYYRGVSDLLGYEILFRKRKSSVEFFINTEMFFYGDRSKLLTKEE